MWAIIAVNFAGFLLAVYLIRRHNSFSLSSSEVFSSGTPFAELRPRLAAIVSGAGDLDAFLDSSGKPLSATRLRFARPEDSFKTVGECLRWLASSARPTALQEAVALVRALYQVGHSTGVASDSTDQAVDVVVSVILGLAPMGSPVEDVRKASVGENLDRDWMAPLAGGIRVARPLGVAVKVNGTYVTKAEVACS